MYSMYYMVYSVYSSVYYSVVINKHYVVCIILFRTPGAPGDSVLPRQAESLVRAIRI